MCNPSIAAQRNKKDKVQLQSYIKKQINKQTNALGKVISISACKYI